MYQFYYKTRKEDKKWRGVFSCMGTKTRAPVPRSKSFPIVGKSHARDPIVNLQWAATPGKSSQPYAHIVPLMTYMIIFLLKNR